MKIVKAIISGMAVLVELLMGFRKGEEIDHNLSKDCLDAKETCKKIVDGIEKKSFPPTEY